LEEVRTAADIYQRLQTLRAQLEQLVGEGRIVMSTDDLATFTESKWATGVALAGLDAAIGAMCWMDTVRDVDGEDPPLSR
jgi:hypothetical protein